VQDVGGIVEGGDRLRLDDHETLSASLDRAEHVLRSIREIEAGLEAAVCTKDEHVIRIVEQKEVAGAAQDLLRVRGELAKELRLRGSELSPIGIGQLPEPLRRKGLLLRGRETRLPVVGGRTIGKFFLTRELVGGDKVRRRVPGGFDEPREDIGGVVQLQELADRVDQLFLVVPLAVGGIWYVSRVVQV